MRWHGETEQRRDALAAHGLYTQREAPRTAAGAAQENRAARATVAQLLSPGGRREVPGRTRSKKQNHGKHRSIADDTEVVCCALCAPL
jgi:hypothetical protein